jgi:large subunit ribosomal protein L25
MDVLSLKLEPREITGKKVKELRQQGIVPVHVYGMKLEPLALQVESQLLGRILAEVGTNVPLTVEIDGKKGEDICFVREVQRHPVTEDVLHVDFMRVDVERTIEAEVPIVLVGTAPGVRELDGTLLQPLQSILVESLPMNVPPSIELDVSALDDFEKAIYVRDVSVSTNVTVLTDSDEMIARVVPPRVEVEEVGEVEEEVEGLEGEEGAEGTEGVAAGEGGPAGP